MLDSYGQTKFQQLGLAHTSTVLLYMRPDKNNRGNHTARALRPEFGRLYHAGEVKEVSKLLSKLNADDALPGIDCMVLEYDTQSLKLLDAINKRPLAPETSHLPMIATVMLLPDTAVEQHQQQQQQQEDGGSSSSSSSSVDETFRANIVAVGGANALASQSLHSKELLYLILDVLHRRRQVELAFRDLKAAKSKAAKYPFFPIFSAKYEKAGHNLIENSVESDGDDFTQLDESVVAPTRKGDRHKHHHSQISQSTGSTASIRELDDWTDASSLLPEFIKENRKRVAREILRTTSMAATNGDDLLQQQMQSPPPRIEIRQRHQIDRTIVRMINSDLQGGDFKNTDAATRTTAEDNGDAVSVFSEDGLDAAGNNNKADDNTVKSEQTKSSRQTNNLKPINARSETCQELLDPRRRPNFSTTPTLEEDETDFKERDMAMRQFFIKPAPALDIPHSVGGLDKKVADNQWKVINLANHESTSDEKIKDRKAHKHNVSGGGSLISTHSSSIGGGTVTQSLSGEGAGSITDGVFANAAQTGVKKTNKKQHGPDAKAIDQATRTLKRLARDNAPDVQCSDLMEVLLTHGKVSVGDRNLLEQGIRCEKEGEVEKAILFYTRSGLHSLAGHLSKLFLGAIHYRLGKFMAALKYFAEAIEILERIEHTPQYSDLDFFTACFNHGVTSFRVGNDDKGIQDLERAVAIMPENLRAQEVLALALRRVGKYNKAIEASIVNNLLRKELRIAAANEEAIANAEKKASKGGNISRPHTTSGGGRGGRNKGSLGGSLGSTSGSASGKNNKLLTNSITSATSQHQEEEFVSMLRTVHVEVDESAGGSMHNRKAVAKQKALESTGDGAGAGVALKSFKMVNALPMDLFEGLFIKPSSLQEALSIPPSQRGSACLDIIVTTLRLMPFLRSCENSIVTELARCVEYRTVAVKGQLYSQSQPADGCCFLLRGSIQARLEGRTMATQNMIVGEVLPHNVVGAIDLLFRDPDSRAVRELLRKCDAAGGGGGGGNNVADEADDDFNIKAINTEGQTAFGGGGDEGSDMGDMVNERDLPRSLRKDMFCSYHMTSLCELLLISESDFQRLLYPTAYDEFVKRLDIIKASGLFSGWRTEDQVRLARMGQVHTYHSGETILTQGSKPTYVYFIMKGMCKSYKRPNKKEILERKLREARERADKHDLKYTYHHKLRHNLSKGVLHIDPNASEKQFNELSHQTHVTGSEAGRYELGLEIAKLDRDLAKEIAKERQEAAERVVDDEAPDESSIAKLAEISTLQWPMLFGEACILDPENGISRGTIIADTTCDVFVVHKTQMQTFRIGPNFFEKVTNRSVKYPEDEALVASRERKAEWELYRVEILSTLTKKKEEYLEPFYV